ncbi:hypothetical protein NXS19_001301 [Fusarium pseudograminearum]|nr:hypothetical protein NXS19_001301 [Fusarium pseudograminearum]
MDAKHVTVLSTSPFIRWILAGLLLPLSPNLLTPTQEHLSTSLVVSYPFHFPSPFPFYHRSVLCDNLT